MCFKSSGRAARLQYMQSQAQIVQEKALQEQQLTQQKKLHEKEMSLQKQALKQQASANETIKASLDKQNAIAERPAPPPPPPAAVMVTGGTAAAESEGDANLEAKRRGRGSLRIDMSSAQTGGGQTGLNVPKG